MIGTLLVALLSFYVEILDTVEFRGIPEEIVFDITDDIWAEPRFWIDRHHIFVASPPYTCILMFSRTGDFIKKIGKKGEAPEEFLGIVDIYGFSDTIYVYSIANKITLLNLDGTYVRSGLLTYLPSLPEAIKVNSKSLLVIGKIGIISKRRSTSSYLLYTNIIGQTFSLLHLSSHHRIHRMFLNITSGCQEFTLWT